MRIVIRKSCGQTATIKPGCCFNCSVTMPSNGTITKDQAHFETFRIMIKDGLAN